MTEPTWQTDDKNAHQLRKALGRQPGECTLCGAQVPRGRRRWCSQACVDQYKQDHDPAFVRRRVEERDRGVCRQCGADTAKIKRIAWLARRDGLAVWQHLGAHYRGLGFDGLWTLWHADHIRPRVLGGGNEMKNLRTLCIPCHKVETAKLAQQRARLRRAGEEPVSA